MYQQQVRAIICNRSFRGVSLIVVLFDSTRCIKQMLTCCISRSNELSETRTRGHLDSLVSPLHTFADHRTISADDDEMRSTSTLSKLLRTAETTRSISLLIRIWRFSAGMRIKLDSEWTGMRSVHLQPCLTSLLRSWREGISKLIANVCLSKSLK